MIFIIIGIVLIIISIIFLFFVIRKNQEVNNLKIEKIKDQEVLNYQYKKLKEDIENLNNEHDNLIDTISKEKEKINNILQSEKEQINDQLELYKNNTNNAKEQYIKTLEEAYEQTEKEHDEAVQKLTKEYEDTLAELNKIKASLNAGIEQRRRDEERDKKIDFYKLTLSDSDLKDLQLLEEIKPRLSHPVILNKYIWSAYFLKQTNDLCTRVLQKTKCGIYKITNLITDEVYIGQSVDIPSRWKTHIKCGLGIDTPSTSKLYASMQKYNVWMFSFELIEDCPANQLNEKEKYWIDMYQSDTAGLNLTKGNR